MPSAIVKTNKAARARYKTSLLLTLLMHVNIRYITKVLYSGQDSAHSPLASTFPLRLSRSKLPREPSLHRTCDYRRLKPSSYRTEPAAKPQKKPVIMRAFCVVPRAGLEPATLRIEASCSNPLSYRGVSPPLAGELMVRDGVVETPSQVWKTCILTVIRIPREQR